MGARTAARRGPAAPGRRAGRDPAAPIGSPAFASCRPPRGAPPACDWARGGRRARASPAG
eukprot:3257615-Pyramimonas_sp.AAC.1